MQNEKRLIDANALGNGIGVYVATNAYLNDTALDALGKVAKWLDEAPTVDAVEVVRCKDCEWYRRDCEVDMCWCTRWTTEFLIHEENFCSYGKRRTNDGHHECFEERCRRWKKDHAFDGERENEER